MYAPTVHSHRARGFSIVELLVVIGVIVVLAGILFPVLMKGWNQAKSVTIRQNLAAIETALNAYKADFGEFPKTRLDNSIEGLVHPNMDGWDSDINKSGLRGARTLCKALVGIGPQGSFASAGYPTDPQTHIQGQDGQGDPTDVNHKKAAAGFRVTGRGGEVNASSKKYGPYLNMDAFRLGETYDSTFELMTQYFPKNYTYNEVSGYTVPNPNGAGTLTAGFFDRFVILDGGGRPILYYPELNPSADNQADQDGTANSGNFITLEETVLATRVSRFRATDNNIGTTLAVQPTFPGLHANTFKLYMGDLNLNGRIDKDAAAGSVMETAARTPGFVLWSAGPNLKFNTATTVAAKKGQDDVTNIIDN